MNITFWVTQDCNLSCSYCYNKAGNNIKKKYMTEAIINDALLLFSKTEAWQEASTLNITFHGGEP